ncbi:hypothetical protein [Streptomyces fuscichromogenes]|uniref:Uncharacterized protein n=1 Tax=Streptomyces fuscichromogenes TaxID=1324013 RepID=A0A917UH94_9ACTN|nr:hypothetical protein [Streptomyces fuscichromogenes]GGM93104.1 hypothetical protein GCM10011578_011470 [Streptomyces fuscichromogenes]
MGEVFDQAAVTFVAMFKWWDVLPDNARQQWTLDPFVSVGPLSFAMSPDEVSEALSDVTAEPQRHTRSRSTSETVSGVKEGAYPEFGLRLYYRQERLAGVVVDALRGPQVFADGMAVVGRVPSVLEQWMTDRAEAREPYTELSYMDAGVPGSNTLGVVIDVQRAGDHLLTRPVFIPAEAVDDLPHFLPPSAWSRCW